MVIVDKLFCMRIWEKAAEEEKMETVQPRARVGRL